MVGTSGSSFATFSGLIWDVRRRHRRGNLHCSQIKLADDGKLISISVWCVLCLFFNRITVGATSPSPPSLGGNDNVGTLAPWCCNPTQSSIVSSTVRPKNDCGDCDVTKVLHFAQDYARLSRSKFCPWRGFGDWAAGCVCVCEWELCYLIKSFSHYLKVHTTLFSSSDELTIARSPERTTTQRITMSTVS